MKPDCIPVVQFAPRGKPYHVVQFAPVNQFKHRKRGMPCNE